ncbi:MAG: LemA family protein [Sphingobacteriaceae bacterium]|nr:LemA family protein [Sphingobacteriaceae bacterium]
MSKGLITAIVFGLIVMFGGFWACNKRNGFVSLREDAKAQWQQVESQYQRRADLIPNIVATVKGEANFEKGTLEAVVQARASATQVKVNLDDMSQESIAKFQAAQGSLSNALGKLMMITENYPNLKANQAFADLRVELEGCENRISVQRMKYNDSSKDYNKAIQMFPGSLIAGSSFQPMPYFEAEAGAEKAPKVSFE